MSVSAAHFKEVTNGYEKRSDGLWVHKGQLDARSLRGTGNTIPPSGAGTELGYVPTAGGQYGYVLAYDRDANVYRDLNLYGRNITLSPQGGTVTFPAGTAQAIIGSYLAGPTFTTSTINAWVATPVSTGSIACSGALCRIECSTAIYNNTPSAILNTGLMIDGVATYTLSISYQGTANFSTSMTWVVYHTPSVANHTFTLGVLANAGTTGISPAVSSTIYVTEQRR